MKLKLQGPSLARAPSKTPEGDLYKYSLAILILYAFCKREPPKFYKLQAQQNLATCKTKYF